MERKFRLRSSIEIQRVRRTGQSIAHPLLVLVFLKGGKSGTRFAVSAGKSVGKAVARNRAKRLIRAALREYLPDLEPGFDGILIARKGLPGSTLTETRDALGSLLNEAGILQKTADGQSVKI